MFAYRPHNNTIKRLHDFYNAAPQSSIPSNFPAIAQRLADLQADEDDGEYSSFDTRTGMVVHAVAPLPEGGYVPEPAMEAPQERDLDDRIAYSRVERAISELSPFHVAVLEAAYDLETGDPKLEAALTPLLVGLASFSKFPVTECLDQPKVMAAIRVELDEYWREAHIAFEKAYEQC